MYAQIGRPSIPPEHLLKSCLLMALYSIRSERQFCERLRYDLLFKWFLGLNVEDEPFDHSSFAKNRRRLLEHRVSRQFFEAVVGQARRRHLLSSSHFTVDGTLLEAWASMKSMRPRDQEYGPGDGNGYTPSNPDVDFKGQRRSNLTHFSRTDPEALMARKGLGKETKMCFAGHVLMENRHGLVVDLELTRASGTSEREAATQMLKRLRERGQRAPGPAGDHAGVPGEPAEAEAGGGDLRLDQDGGDEQKTALQGGGTQPALGGDDHGGLQPGSNGQAGGGSGLRDLARGPNHLPARLLALARAVSDPGPTLRIPRTPTSRGCPASSSPSSTPC